MPLYRSKSRGAINAGNFNLPKTSSFSESDFSASRKNSTSKNAEQANGGDVLQPATGTSRKLAKSTFYTEAEKIYPSSCVHTAQTPQMNPIALAKSCVDLSEEATLSKSLSIPNLNKASSKKKPQKVDKYATMRSSSSQKLQRSMRAKSSSRVEMNDSASEDWSDISFSNNPVVLNNETPNSDILKTYYFSYGNLFESESPNSERKKDECLKTTSPYNGHILREVGENGAVVSLVGCDVLLHVAARPPVVVPQTCPTCLLSSNVKLTRHRYPSTIAPEQKTGKKFSGIVNRSMSDRLKDAGPRLIDYDCPIISNDIVDGRILLGLEDPPNCDLLSIHFKASPKKKGVHQQNDVYFVIAGPAVNLDIKDKRTIEGGAIVQLPINVSLKDSEQPRLSNKRFSKSEQSCKVACLQSTARDGPYREVKSCYTCGDNLQVTIDTSQLPSPATTGTNHCEVYVIPVVKRGSLGLEFVLDGIKTKNFHVGIYGSRYSYEKNTYCVSLSSSGFNPPVFQFTHPNGTELTLRLLGSHVIRAHHFQGYKMDVKTLSAAFALDTDLSDCGFTRLELFTEARIFRVFTLKRNPQFQSFENDQKSFSKHKFTVELTGLSDGNVLKIMCNCPQYKENNFPASFSHEIAARLAENMETSPCALVEAKLHDIPFQWVLGQLADRLHFQNQLEISVSKRRVFGIKLAYTLKAHPSKKKNLSLPSYLLRCSSEDYLPVLSKYSLLMNDINGKTKEWWICYHKHKIGLVRTSSIKILEYNDFSSWNEVRLEIGKVVEAITSPVLTLESESLPIEQKLRSQIKNWTLFSAAMRFGESFAATSISTEQDENLRSKKISYYLYKLIEYRTSSRKMRQFHYDVMKALVFSEHYDLATDLAADLALLNIAMNIGEVNWTQLVDFLVGRSAEDDYQNFLQLQHYVEENWRPIYDYLCKWRERFGDNHKGALFALHQAVGHLPLETAFLPKQILTDLVILVRTFETLCQFDSNL